jgi:hypothetical protein
MANRIRLTPSNALFIVDRSADRIVTSADPCIPTTLRLYIIHQRSRFIACGDS